jgi:replicative DNA helicase
VTEAPPQNKEAEENVLGAILISPGALDACSEILAPSDFYFGSHGTIYAAALELAQRGEPVDRLTLENFLDQRKQLKDAGGPIRLAELAALVPATANAAHHARIIVDKARRRALIAAGRRIQEIGQSAGDTREDIDVAQQLVYELTGVRRQGELEPIVDALRDAYDAARAASKAEGGITGTPSGLRDLDRLTGGFKPGNLILLAGRPSMGKSALAFNISAHLTLRKKQAVALFTLEMSRLEVAQRLIATEARIDSQRVHLGQLDSEEWVRLDQAVESVGDAPLYLDDSPLLTPLEMRSKVRRFRARRPELALCVVDYLQLMVGGQAEHRVAEVGKVSRSLKLAARELDVPLLALSQLSRASEQRENRRPKLSDLRDSGSLEQDADLVLFVHRENKQAREGILIVDKNRNGPTGDVDVTWLAERAAFSPRAHGVAA